MKSEERIVFLGNSNTLDIDVVYSAEGTNTNSRHGIWLYKNKHGTVVKKEVYDNGVLMASYDLTVENNGITCT